MYIKKKQKKKNCAKNKTANKAANYQENLSLLTMVKEEAESHNSYVNDDFSIQSKESEVCFHDEQKVIETITNKLEFKDKTEK